MSNLDQLASRARDGDAEALEDLLVASQPDMKRFALQSCRTGEDAEDAVQHALIVVYSKIGAFRAASRFTSWVFAIIRNECTRIGHAAARLVHREDPHAEVTREDHEDQFEQVDLLSELVAAISELPDDLRAVFVLRSVEGYSTAETATLLTISESNTKVRLHRARAQLREALSK